ncbi:class I SAM-dependent methyltransferase [Microbacterium sp. NPDC057659]|uniref:class I SAM-dependent methyltransferase n=1 Tax=Microbacterium sp. NPDC057659 TaxID=3346198 RepID=UPI00367131F9
MRRLLAAVGRFNAAHPWSHNDAFARYVLRHARAVGRAGGRTALDVGCGTGNLVVRLSEVLPQVIGLEPDPGTAATAKARFAASDLVRVEERRFGDEPDAAYDLIVFVASLHHMPLRATLRQAKRALRPGGRVVIVGVAAETRADLPRSVASLVLNPIIGFVRHPRLASAPPAAMRAPTAEPDETFDEVRAVLVEELPGARMRRRLFWRYTAHWIAPR